MEPENLFRLLNEYKIEATLMRTQSAATKLLDHIDGWQKVYADDIATIHVREHGAVHTVEQWLIRSRVEYILPSIGRLIVSPPFKRLNALKE